MSFASVIAASPSVDSLHSGTVYESSERSFPAMQNGQCHATYDASVNTTSGRYVDSSVTSPLLSGRHSDSSDDDDYDEDSEVLNSDSLIDSLKHDVATSVGEETSLRIAFQVFFPYLIAGFGMVGAGAVLEIVKVRSLFSV